MLKRVSEIGGGASLSQRLRLLASANRQASFFRQEQHPLCVNALSNVHIVRFRFSSFRYAVNEKCTDSQGFLFKVILDLISNKGGVFRLRMEQTFRL